MCTSQKKIAHYPKDVPEPFFDIDMLAKGNVRENYRARVLFWDKQKTV
jgi:hypothetical protein